MITAHFKVGDKVSCVLKGETVNGVVKSVTQTRTGFDVTMTSERNSEITGDQGEFRLVAAVDNPPPPPKDEKAKEAGFPWWALLVVGAIAYHATRGSK